MDCCGSSKPKETDKETKQEQTGTDPVEKEQKHSGGCCGSGMKDMLVHITLMIVVVLVIKYLTRG